MSTMTQQEQTVSPLMTPVVTAGVDTHADSHTVAVVDVTGRLVGDAQFTADPAGYRAAAAFMARFGRLDKVGVEGTGAYGAGLTRYLRRSGIEVVEVDRPDRKTRRFAGKSDPIDALAAAHAVLAGTRTGVPKQRDGQVEALRMVRVARRSAVTQRADCQRRIRSLIITVPDQLRHQLQPLTLAALIDTCARLRPDPAGLGDPVQAAKLALRTLARRHQALTAEIDDLDQVLQPLVAAINPDLLSIKGVGVDVAGQLLVTVGQNPERIRSEAAFAAICGVAPIPASSGKTHRHRLNRGGDRQANAALYRIVLGRLRWDARTRAYVERRTAEGLSKKDIIRCLKRHLIREIYPVLITTQTA